MVYMGQRWADKRRQCISMYASESKCMCSVSDGAPVLQHGHSVVVPLETNVP